VVVTSSIEKAATFGQRQAARRGRHRHVGEACAAREILEQEARHVQVLGRGDAAGRQHQALRRGVQLVAGRFQRLVFDGVLVRLEQQLLDHGLHRGRQHVGLELLDIAGLHQRLLLFLFDAGLGRAQRRSGAAL
jgi:hypothetical protein